MTESKNLFILGDSYSTFEGKIPDDCETWYLSDYPDTRAGQTDVCKYEQTWVHQFLKESGYHLDFNDSFPGQPSAIRAMTAKIIRTSLLSAA